MKREAYVSLGSVMPMKLSRIDMFWGCLLIAIGVGFFGDSLRLWNFEFFFCGWWTLFIIVPSLCNILEEGVKRLNVIGLSVGGLLLLSSWKLLPAELVVPLLLIIIGATLIFIRSNGERGK